MQTMLFEKITHVANKGLGNFKSLTDSQNIVIGCCRP
jgi:hypothetical protein